MAGHIAHTVGCRDEAHAAPFTRCIMLEFIVQFRDEFVVHWVSCFWLIYACATGDGLRTNELIENGQAGFAAILLLALFIPTREAIKQRVDFLFLIVVF